MQLYVWGDKKSSVLTLLTEFLAKAVTVVTDKYSSPRGTFV